MQLGKKDYGWQHHELQRNATSKQKQGKAPPFALIEVEVEVEVEEVVVVGLILVWSKIRIKDTDTDNTFYNTLGSIYQMNHLAHEEPPSHLPTSPIKPKKPRNFWETPKTPKIHKHGNPKSTPTREFARRRCRFQPSP